MQMYWFHQLYNFQGDSIQNPPPPATPLTPNAETSPAMLYIIVILAIIFFISGLLHLLAKFITRHRPSSSDFPSNSGTFQRQLHQLFNLHDTGLDQEFIDALPVFQYKEILGLKEPFDCAVCLCEFSDQDKLRLLPLCSHAFHTECIDTWLLSNSTCPLCRGALCTPTLITGNPIFGFEECREEDGVVGLSSNEAEIASEKGKVFNVRLGKFRSSNDEDSEGVRVDGDVGESSSSNLDARRCFSMGSYQYVVADSELQVTLPSNRTANDGDPRISEARDGFNAVGMKDSFSVSKIWLWSKKDNYCGSSNRHIGNHTSVNMSLPWKNVA